MNQEKKILTFFSNRYTDKDKVEDGVLWRLIKEQIIFSNSDKGTNRTGPAETPMSL